MEIETTIELSVRFLTDSDRGRCDYLEFKKDTQLPFFPRIGDQLEIGELPERATVINSDFNIDSGRAYAWCRFNLDWSKEDTAAAFKAWNAGD